MLPLPSGEGGAECAKTWLWVLGKEEYGGPCWGTAGNKPAEKKKRDFLPTRKAGRKDASPYGREWTRGMAPELVNTSTAAEHCERAGGEGKAAGDWEAGRMLAAGREGGGKQKLLLKDIWNHLTGCWGLCNAATLQCVQSTECDKTRKSTFLNWVVFTLKIFWYLVLIFFFPWDGAFLYSLGRLWKVFSLCSSG